MKPGPQPKSSCASEYHLRLNEKQRRILNNMGLGKPLDKILHLIDQEGERQQPKTKVQLLAKWERDRRELIKLAATTNEEKAELIKLGCTLEDLKNIEESAENAPAG